MLAARPVSAMTPVRPAIARSQGAGDGRRTLRRRWQSAARLAVVTTACLPERDTEPGVARRDDDALRQRDVGFREVADGPAEAAAATAVIVRPMHLTTIRAMSEDARR